jgi:hypothetical protein
VQRRDCIWARMISEYIEAPTQEIGLPNPPGKGLC